MGQRAAITREKRVRRRISAARPSHSMRMRPTADADITFSRSLCLLARIVIESSRRSGRHSRRELGVHFGALSPRSLRSQYIISHLCCFPKRSVSFSVSLLSFLQNPASFRRSASTRLPLLSLFFSSLLPLSGRDRMTQTHEQLISVQVEGLGNVSVGVESCTSFPHALEIEISPTFRFELTSLLVAATSTFDSTKPTLLMLHSFSTSTKLYSCASPCPIHSIFGAR